MNTPDSAFEFVGEGKDLPVLEAVEVCSGPSPAVAIIWLHGLGADGHDFEPIVPFLKWPGMPDTRFVFPHAPVRPVTLNGGMPMRAWYDITSIDSDRGHDQAGVEGSIFQVKALVEREQQRGIASDRIVLAGFSQGGAIAVQLALRYPHKLAGLVALSTYLLFSEQLERRLHSANRNIPVLIAHGNADPVVPVSMGENLRDRLQSVALPVTWQSYPMEHSVCPAEIQDICRWLAQRFE